MQIIIHIITAAFFNYHVQSLVQSRNADAEQSFSNYF